MSLLRTDDLAFGYRGIPVGRNVTLAVERGEVLVLLGPNGCGKTTFFKTLLGLLPRQGGHLLLDGRDIAAYGRAEFARLVALVPQAHGATFPFTVREMVLMGRASRVATFAAPSARDHEVCEATMNQLGILHLADRPFPDVSGGERQMTLIARALAQEPVMLVMDEPTASLDFGNQTRVLQTVRDLKRSGLAIVFSTHDPGHAFAVGTRVALLKDGTIRAIGTPEEVVTSRTLRDLYGVDVSVDYVPNAGRHVCVPILDEPEQEQEQEQEQETT